MPIRLHKLSTRATRGPHAPDPSLHVRAKPGGSATTSWLLPKPGCRITDTAWAARRELCRGRGCLAGEIKDILLLDMGWVVGTVWVYVYQSRTLPCSLP
jgi:hypothetical protein